MSKKFIILVLGIGILVRLVLSAITFHQDITAFDLGGRIVAGGNILNLYDYIGNLPNSNELLKNYPPDFLIYPPAIYLTQGLFAFIFNPLFSIDFSQNFLVNFPQTINSWQLYLHLLFLKLPYLVFDITTAFLLAKLFETKKDKMWAFALWIFNPITLFSSFMMGQFDVIPVFFTVLALFILQKYNWSKKSLYIAVLSLGFGAAYKIYPLFLILPLAFAGNNIREKIKIFLIGITPYFLMILPYLNSKGFHSSALVASQTLKSFYATIPISGGEAIILFPFILIFFYLLYFYKIQRTIDFIWQSFLTVLLLFFIFTHYHPQWFIWVTPFLAISLIKSQFKLLIPMILMLISFLALLFFFDPGLTTGLFAPLNKGLYQSKSIFELVGISPDYNFARSLFQTLFASAAVYLIYYYFPKNKLSN